MQMDFIFTHMNYWLFVVLMMTGFYTVISRGNYIKKIVGLNVFQVSVFMFYISISKVTGGTAPIYPVDLNIDPNVIYSNPLPHVLILTAIVVGVATTSLGLALIIRIHEAFGTIEEDELHDIENRMKREENATLGASETGNASGSKLVEGHG